ncbi:TPA: hypothetical protein N0F65_004245 [Lagenidium giganteum]|uniref:Macro domain-containing protein n=1 Tax=Lagenidium giganteum TaxID=4803 RepID=A0AAV2ZGA9_9STRA|nr:TPA: hypothetical protein N0F65_004245 [Lagenidium giganteum]
MEHSSVDALTLPRWGVATKEDTEIECNSDQVVSAVPFTINASINSKVALWSGQIWRLKIDAIVNSTNESLRDTSGLCRKIYDAAGKEIWVECDAAEVCRTGEAVITRGCQLPARKIIHTVGPRYNIKYHNAAENALHMCYRSVLSAAKEERLRSVAFSCVYSKQKGYPRDEAAHIAARTVRRFLEHYGDDFDLVIFCVDTTEDQLIYESVLPLYFPRTPTEEAKTSTLLSRDLGDEFGEPIIEERKIRISQLGSRQLDCEATEYDHEGISAETASDDEDAAIQDFCEMAADPDTERLEWLRQQQEERQRSAARAQQTRQEETVLTYQRALAKAQREDFEDLKALKFIYNGGVDHSGSPVIVYISGNLPIDDVDLDRVMLFIIYTLDGIVENTYSVLYVHSGVLGENQPQATWLKRLFRTLSTKYQANLKYFYMLEPTMWLKLVILIAKGFVSRDFYRKIVYLSTARELDNIAPPLNLPAGVYGKPSDAENEKSEEPQSESEDNSGDNNNEAAV